MAINNRHNTLFRLKNKKPRLTERAIREQLKGASRKAFRKASKKATRKKQIIYRSGVRDIAEF